MIPLTKYFCTNGYTMMIGRVATIVTAIRMLSLDTGMRLAFCAICWASVIIAPVWNWFRILTRTACSVLSSGLYV
ncbi:hypothetical protein D3C81_1256690 [compost metagenome]